MPQAKALSDIRTAVRDNLDEATASFWTQAQMLRLINRAKDRVWLEVRKLKDDYFVRTLSSTDASLTILGATYTPSSLQVTAGGATLTLPTDYAELKSIEVIQSGYEYVQFFHLDMARPEFRALRAVTTQRAPTAFYFDIYGLVTLLYTPLSNTALDTRIYYVFRLADYSADTDTLDLPDPTYLAVIEYATALAQLMDRDEYAAVWENSGRRTLADFFGSSARQIQDPIFVSGSYEDW